MRALALLALAALVATTAHGASDCFEPLRANPGWRCHADLPDGQAVDYCLERTNAFGAGPASRSFKLIATGPYPSSCSCSAKGKLPGTAFGEDKTFLCLYRDTDAVVSGKITKRKMTGQTFSAAYDLRSVFSCQPDPACDVPPVLDPDLPATAGFADILPDDPVQIPVTAGGPVDVAYFPGCGGYASEAPNAVYHVEPSVPGEIEIAVFGTDPDRDALLVITPSGAVHCVDYVVYLPLERGAYRAWGVFPTPGADAASIQGVYRAD